MHEISAEWVHSAAVFFIARSLHVYSLYISNFWIHFSKRLHKKGTRTGVVDKDAMKEVIDKTSSTRKAVEKCSLKLTTFARRLTNSYKKTTSPSGNSTPERIFNFKFTYKSNVY